MHAFLWDQRFETGIEIVDRQHQHLVDVVNQLGQLLESGADLSGDTLQTLFHDLAQYAHRHFADEENLMRESGIDERHQQAHARHHRQFVEQVVSLWNARATLLRPAEMLHGFLASWLTVHILGEDQTMARQMAAVRNGTPANEAYGCNDPQADTATTILLGAMQRLYGVVSEQNQNLANINQSLETRIAERTAELRLANEQLAEEQRELTELLSKVESAQQQLLQSEKMAAIGQLAAGVAHEINNPVGFVNSNIGTLKTYTSQLLAVIAAYEAGDPAAIAAARQKADLDFLREDLPTLIQESQEGLGRVTRIVQDLKDFSHVDEAEQQDADLNAGIESTLNVVANELKYKADERAEGIMPGFPAPPGAPMEAERLNAISEQARRPQGARESRTSEVSLTTMRPSIEKLIEVSRSSKIPNIWNDAETRPGAWQGKEDQLEDVVVNLQKIERLARRLKDLFELASMEDDDDTMQAVEADVAELEARDRRA
jgi:two-component system NtrC family sensor kinase